MALKLTTADKNPLINSDGSITSRPCSIRDLMLVYGVSYKTMRTWLIPFKEEIGTKKSYMFTVLQVDIIFEKIGKPKFFDLDKFSKLN
jgi:hypothetical protein